MLFVQVLEKFYKKILYVDTLHANMPIYRESVLLCINSETILLDQRPESYHIEWDNVSDDKKNFIR